MRSVIENREVQVQGVGEVADFTIKATGKAFKVLIDGLYSDKIRAVIREICSNAYDAHAAAGCADKPFELQLPNAFEPIFRVRDFGTGMSHETVMRLYTRVFESSKEDTNEQVGKLGLGSKSPFAYTDTFTVTTWDGTTQRTYSAFIGSKYVPQIALMTQEASNAPRGVEIQFPVVSSDIFAFTEAARVTLRGFDTLPKIIGARVEIKPLETVMSGDGWKLVKNTDTTYGLKAHAKQGCVIYPLDPNALDHITPFERAILSSPFFIDFPIGELEISASRESLGYDDATKANIRRRLKNIADEIVKTYQQEIDAQPTMWRACVAFKKVMRSNLHGGVLEVLKSTIKYRGKPLQPRQDLSNFLRPLFEKGTLKAMHVDNYTLGRLSSFGSRRPTLKFEATIYMQIEAGETVVIFDDAEKPASIPQARIRHWYLNLPENERRPIIWVKAEKDSMAFRRLLVELGRPDTIINLADMEKPPLVPGVNTRRPTKVKLLQKSSWVETEIDESDEVIYVQLNKRDTMGPNGTYTSSPTSVQNVVNMLVKLGVLKATDNVYGIPQTHKSKIDDNEHWVEFWSLAKKARDEKHDEAKAIVVQSYARKVAEYTPMARFFIDLARWEAFDGFNDPKGPASRLLAQWENAVEKAKSNETLQTALELNISLGGSPPVAKDISFGTFEMAFNTAYPLVPILIGDNRYINPTLRKHIIDYVNLVDSAKNISQGDTANDAKAA